MKESVKLCPKCDTANLINANYCRRCGEDIRYLLDALCSKCTYPKHVNDRYCSECGKRDENAID